MGCAGRADRRRRFGSVPEQRLWMRFPALPCKSKRRRAGDRCPSLAAAVQKTFPTQGQASLAEHTDSTRSVCLTWPRWERGRLARPGAAKGRCSGLRPRLRTGRPRSQRGFVTPRNVQSPHSRVRGNDIGVIEQPESLEFRALLSQTPPKSPVPDLTTIDFVFRKKIEGGSHCPQRRTAGCRRRGQRLPLS